MRHPDSEERDYESDIEEDDTMDEAMPFDEETNIDDELEAAGLVEGWCPECRAMKPHKVLKDGSHAIVCAECNCMHRNEKDVLEAKPLVHGILKPEEKKSAALLQAAWERLTSGVNETAVIRYSIHADLNEGDIISHTKFGRGIVVARLEQNKVEVLFKDELKRLVCCK